MGGIVSAYTVDGSNAQEQETHQWFAEASELRFPPGSFPTRIGTPLGNGQDFVLTRVDADRTHYYGQIFGCIRLTVWND